MLKIQVVFETEGFDPRDPTGEILISDGPNRIWQEHAYLDSWLDGLIRGLQEVEAGRSVSVDLVEEPDPLMLQPQDGGMKLIYDDTTVSVSSVDEFRRTLKSASMDFLDKLHIADEASDTELLNSIRKFVRTNLPQKRSRS